MASSKEQSTLLTPETLALIVQGISALIVAAPQAIELVGKTKEFVSGMFGSALITKAQQDAIHAHIDALQAMNVAGIVPPHWQVEPDPQT